MRETRLMMGMPVTLDVGPPGDQALIDRVFAYFESVDRRFSTYRGDSEITLINKGEAAAGEPSDEMREVLAIAGWMRERSGGYFNIRRPGGVIDPSGVVKGWAIRNAAAAIRAAGVRDFFVDAGGDVQSGGSNPDGRPWRVGVRNPFDERQIIKVVCPRGRGVATSGTYVRGHHIYNPHRSVPVDEIVSLTVIGADVLEADLFATAAFAMGRDGIYFIEQTPGLEGYVVGIDGRGTPTSGFEGFCAS